jgi:cyclophilin family peptidyl-prolyl cis-trans isomerase
MKRLSGEAYLAAVLGSLLLMTPPGASAKDSPTLEPRVRFQTTAGDFVVELDPVRAPLTAENFLRYVREGLYDGTLIHRVVPNFVVQGGGYRSDYSELPLHGPIPNESGNGLYNRRGALGMARGESPHSATSQFYINLNDNAGLNPLPSRWGYAVFGEVVEGMDVIDRIAHVVTGQRGPFGADAPLQPILVRHAGIVDETLPAGVPPAAPPATAEAAAGDRAAGQASGSSGGEGTPPAAAEPSGSDEPAATGAGSPGADESDATSGSERQP